MRSRWIAFVVVLLSALVAQAVSAVPGFAAGSYRVTPGAIAGLRIGMTKVEALNRFTKATTVSHWGAAGCILVNVRHDTVTGLITPSSRRRIVGVVVADAPARTAAGVGMGSSISQVRRAYRHHASILRHPMDGVTVLGVKSGPRWIGFVAEGRGVESIRVGDEQFAALGSDKPCGQ